MTLPSVPTRRGFTRLGVLLLPLFFLTALWSAHLDAQCSLSGAPIAFEPNPPGATRPTNLASGKQFDLQVYQGGGSTRMLMMEAFGYSILDLTSPTQPTATIYDNMAMSGEMPSVGDGQSYVASMGVSADGARAAFSLNGNASPAFGTVVAAGSANGFDRIKGDFAPRGGSGGTVVQKVGNRYLAYVLLPYGGSINPGTLSVVDVTNLPSSLTAANLTSETVTSSSGGFNLSVAGSNVLYIVNGTIQIVNASTPGPPGNIQSGFQYSSIGSADVGGGTPTSFSAAVDPADSSKLWVLVETSGPLAYALVSVRGGVKTSAGAPFPIPTAGGTWVGGGVSALIQSGSNLFAFMWAKQNAPNVLYRLFSNSVSAWGIVTPGQFDVDPAVYPLFALRSSMRGLAGPGTDVYGYVPTGNSAFVLPMSCVSSNAPAIASMAVTDQAGTPLVDGATVYLGDTITITPAVNPPTSIQPLTGFGWNFDFDFHAGVAFDDNGVPPASPRLHAPDNAAFGSPATPPALITLVGPCDPQVAGTSPGSGAGCWASVKGNAAYAGGTSDFTGAEVAGTAKPLRFAFEANNALGSAGASTFTLNWKVPAIRLKSAQILSGGSVDATGSDGHPSGGTGYKWYFGSTSPAPAGEILALDASCTGPTCAHAFPGTGTRTFNVWTSVPYANGYVSPDCPGLPTACQPTTPLTVQVADFLPSFLVAGKSGPPVTLLTNTTFNVTNQSQAGAVTGISYEYSLCTDMTGAAAQCTTYLPLNFAGTIAPVATPSTTGAWYLRIRVHYTASGAQTIDWLPTIPTVSDPKAFPLVVSNVIPVIHVFINGVDPCAPGFACNPSQVDAFTGDVLTAYSFVSGAVDPNPPAISWSFPGASPGSGSGQGVPFSYTAGGAYTITMNGYGTPYSVSAQITQRSAAPLSVNASASPNPASVNASVNFTCSASGGSGSGYNYTWTNAVAGSGQSISRSFATPGTYQAQCNVTDSASHAAGAVVNFTISGGGCTSADFHITVGGAGSFPSPGFSVATGDVVTFIPNGAYSSWSWSFGDGGSSTEQTPTHAYTGPGTYTVSLTANGNCTRSYQMVVTGAGTGGPSSACTTVDFSILDGSTGLASCGPFGCSGISGAALSFVPNPAMSVPFTSWNFGDGSTSATPQGSHTYAGGGTFTVTLTAGTCTKTKDISISGPVALSGSFIAKYADNSAFQASQVASGKAVSFLAIDTADTYTWDFGDGTAPATGQTPSHTYVTPGMTPFTYTATLSVTRGTGTGAQNASTTQSFTIIPPPEPPKWFVAGLAYLQGALEGTLWKTDVTLFNPDPSRPGTYSLAFLDGGNPVDPANLVWKTITVGAQQAASSTNVLGDFFGQPLGSHGALLVRGDSAPVPPVLTARTFNSGDPAKGTFGLSVPSTQPSSGLTPQAALSQQFLIGLRDDDSAYTNIGLMNLTTDWSHARLTFLDRSGATTLGQVNVDVPPFNVAQLSRPLFASPPNGVGFPDPLDTFSVKVSVLSGGSVFPYATVIDRRSTDSVVVTVSDRPSSTYRMPGIIRSQGANNTVWRSRFYITNPSSTSRKASVSYSFIPCDETGCKSRVTGLQSDVTLLPGETLWADDFPKVWLAGFGFGVSDATSYQSSYIDVAPAVGDPNQEPLLVFGETYNDQPGGPVGLQVPGFTDADAASKTGANRRLLLTGLVSNASYRSNVALFLQSGTSGQCTVRVLSDVGVELGRQDVAFSGTSTFHQLNDSGLFGALTGNKDRLTVVVDSLDGSPIAGYATIIDNTSGDATFLKAQPAP